MARQAPGSRENTGARNGMGRGTAQGHQHVGTTDERLLDQAEIDDEIRGNDRLAADDAADVENARQTWPEQQDEAEPDYPSNEEAVTGRPGRASKSARI